MHRSWNTAVDGQMAETETGSQEAEAQEKGGKKGLLMLIVAVVVAVGASVGGTLYFVGQDSPAEDAVAVAGNLAQPAIYHEMRPSFIVNYNTATKPRFLQAELSVMARDPELIGALIDHTPLVRARVLKELSDATFDEIRTHEGKEALRDQLRKALNELLSQETQLSGVESVLFTNFVLQ